LNLYGAIRQQQEYLLLRMGGVEALFDQPH